MESRVFNLQNEIGHEPERQVLVTSRIRVRSYLECPSTKWSVILITNNVHLPYAIEYRPRKFSPSTLGSSTLRFAAAPGLQCRACGSTAAPERSAMATLRAAALLTLSALGVLGLKTKDQRLERGRRRLLRGRRGG